MQPREGRDGVLGQTTPLESPAPREGGHGRDARRGAPGELRSGVSSDEAREAQEEEHKEQKYLLSGSG